MKQAYTSAAIGGVLFLTITFVPVLGYFPIDAHLLNAWQHAPTTPIAQLQVGELAKVRGVLGAYGSVALGGAQRSGYTWSWNTSDVFTIADLSGTATVTVTSTWLIMPASHLAGWAVTSSGQPDYAATYYAPGDAVTILGVVGSGNGAPRSLSALVLGVTGTSVSVPLTDVVVPILGAGLLGFGWVWMLASVADHAILHRRKVRGVSLQTVTTLADVKDTSVEWHPNLRWTSARPRLYGGLLVGAFVGWGLGLWTYALVPVGVILFIIVGFIVIVLGWFAYVGLYLWVFQPAAPTFIAFSGRGFHLWYDSPYDRELHDDLIQWDSLQTITVVPLPKGGKMWMMRRKDGEVDNMSYLTVENRNAAVSAWELHRPRSPEGLAAGGAPVSEGRVDHVRVDLGRGANFQFSLVLVGLGGLFGGFLALRGLTLNPGDPFYPSELTGDILIGGMFGIIFLIGVIGALMTRGTRSLEVDSESVQIFRGPRPSRRILWTDVTRVACGLKMGRAVAYYIDVRGGRGVRPIKLNSFVFRVSRDDLARAGEVILTSARDHGVPAQEYALPAKTG